MDTSHPIRVVLVDDHLTTHELVTLALHGASDIHLIGHGANGEEAIMLCEQYMPDIVLMDVMMPIMNGVEATQTIMARFPTVKILVLSSFQDDESVHGMLQHGAVGYILKGALHSDLAATIRAAHNGSIIFSKSIADRLLFNTDGERGDDFGLTEREREVLRDMSAGFSLKEIADRLVISPSTVKFHLTNILGKMGVQTRAEAIVLAAKHNLV
ncbi:MAG TPA: response regulator transcription factor [Aggregatilineales bacterium]|nr:response regulator transcription factor [Anaerolineales bacterium]HRE49554.1 response regulator transcription factor [Aggregatilineales bacterium]